MASFQTDNSDVLRPFGTGTSCMDTINGDCLENVTLEECMDHCENSDYCQAGIFVHPGKTSKTYCAPLNTYQTTNVNYNTSFVKNRNATPLSDSTTFFYDKKYFDPEKNPPEEAIFSNDPLNIAYHEKNKEPLYLNANLSFQIFPSTPPFLVAYFPRNYSSNYRLLNNETIGFHLFTEFKNIQFNDSGVAFWNVYAPEVYAQSFFIEMLNESTFVNSGQPFQLVSATDSNLVWSLDKEKKLVLAPKEKGTPTRWLTFEKRTIQEDLIASQQKENTILMEKYLNANFGDMSNTFSSDTFAPLGLLILVFLLFGFLLFLISLKKI